MCFSCSLLCELSEIECSPGPFFTLTSCSSSMHRELRPCVPHSAGSVSRFHGQPCPETDRQAEGGGGRWYHSQRVYNPMTIALETIHFRLNYSFAKMDVPLARGDARLFNKFSYNGYQIGSIRSARLKSHNDASWITIYSKECGVRNKNGTGHFNTEVPSRTRCWFCKPPRSPIPTRLAFHKTALRSTRIVLRFSFTG